MFTAFDADLGSEQGRIASDSAPLGDYLFQLGSDVPRKVFRFAPSDFVSVNQAVADLTGGPSFLKYSVVIRGCEVLPEGASWELSMQLDGTTMSIVEIGRWRNRRLSDQGIRLHGLTGPHDITFRLLLLGLDEDAEVELPGCAVDALVEASGEPILYNRRPEPNEIDHPVDSPIVFRIEAGAGTVDLTRTRVLIDDVVVYDGSLSATTWATHSTVTAYTEGNSNGYVFSFLDEADLASETVYTIEVHSAVVAGPPDAVFGTWTFTTEDIEAPSLIEAFATTETTVRVTFDDAVLQDGSAASALTIANYTLVIVSGQPAVLPTITSITAETSASVLVQLDREMTRNAVYRITATTLQDTSGNAIAAPTNTATFTGYLCPAPSDRDIAYFSTPHPTDPMRHSEGILPYLAQEMDKDVGDLRKLASVYQEVTDLLLCYIDRWPRILDPDTAPDEWLDHMLSDLGNPFTFILSTNDKRRLAQILVDIYRSKGTGVGIVNAIRLFLGIDVTLNVPGWAPLGLGDAALNETFVLGSSDPEVLLTFQIRVEQTLTDEQRSRLLAIVDYMSDAREFFVLYEPPGPPPVYDHWALGFSLLGSQSTLHAD